GLLGYPGHAALTSTHVPFTTRFRSLPTGTLRPGATTASGAAAFGADGWNVMVIGERPSLDKWLSIHYIPTDSNAWGGAGETLEDAVADFGIAQLAGRLGDTTTRTQFLARAQYWKNVFNPARGFIQNRNENGTFPALDPASDDGFAEGSSAQYTWMV